MPCVYILFSQKLGKFYIGSSRSNTPSSRLKNHNSGKVRSTKYGRPWLLIHQEVLPSYTEARKRELFLKTGKGREWIYNRFESLKRRGAPNG
ncbi:MAG: GIY-YIG nuclease family protein [bacterium]|nr:GIY-YIG nuclease family protein [bacterium]